MPTKEEVIRLLARMDRHSDDAENWSQQVYWQNQLAHLYKLAKLAGLIS